MVQLITTEIISWKIVGIALLPVVAAALRKTIVMMIYSRYAYLLYVYPNCFQFVYIYISATMQIFPRGVLSSIVHPQCVFTMRACFPHMIQDHPQCQSPLSRLQRLLVCVPWLSQTFPGTTVIFPYLKKSSRRKPDEYYVPISVACAILCTSCHTLYLSFFVAPQESALYRIWALLIELCTRHSGLENKQSLA